MSHRIDPLSFGVLMVIGTLSLALGLIIGTNAIREWIDRRKGR